MMTSRFDFIKTKLPGAVIAQRKRNDDTRGYFSRFYCANEFRDAGYELPIAQINHSMTERRGTVRGLHFQRSPHSEVKLVSCLKGEVFDVAVDLRADSPTFLQWHAETLSEDNARSFYIPEGFAHGFQALTDECELLYLHSVTFTPQAEGGVNIMDNSLSISWPLDITTLSDRDRSFPPIDPDFARLKP